jgi:hypothetical protein
MDLVEGEDAPPGGEGRDAPPEFDAPSIDDIDMPLPDLIPGNSRLVGNCGGGGAPRAPKGGGCPCGGEGGGICRAPNEGGGGGPSIAAKNDVKNLMQRWEGVTRLLGGKSAGCRHRGSFDGQQQSHTSERCHSGVHARASMDAQCLQERRRGMGRVGEDVGVEHVLAEVGEGKLEELELELEQSRSRSQLQLQRLSLVHHRQRQFQPIVSIAISLAPQIALSAWAAPAGIRARAKSHVRDPNCRSHPIEIQPCRKQINVSAPLPTICAGSAQLYHHCLCDRCPRSERQPSEPM